MSPAPLSYAGVQLAAAPDLAGIAKHLFALMLRNIATDGFVFTDPNDPANPAANSLPGVVIASPSFERTLASVNQDYVYNWTRDSAIVALELAAGDLTDPQPLGDYVRFAAICQAAGPPIGHACYTIAGGQRPWTEQSDGPALRVLAILAALPRLDTATRATALAVISADLDYLLAGYRNPTFNLWEERTGYSFFARAVQLRCFTALTANTLGVPVPAGVGEAAAWLAAVLPGHWDAAAGIYLTFGGPDATTGAIAEQGYDPNVDVVMAAVYGGVAVTDTRLLATAAAIRAQWAEPAAPTFYPINGADADRGIGPLVGRYPGDTYDGDTADPASVGHPWALCTANLAELHYRLATAVTASETLPLDGLSAPFFSAIGVQAATPVAQAATALRSAGDAMLQALVFHSDHLELSEQFDRDSGYCKSVSDLTWSYAAFLSAVRAGTVTG